MVFVDHAQITVSAGAGGRGCSAFAQPPYIRYPFPDGGDGGDGGNVIVRANPNIATLLDFQFRHEFTAGRGGHGGSNKKTGKRGDDLLIHVPVGTVILDEAGELVRDLTRPGEQVTVAHGGRGGLGNANPASHPTPRGAVAPNRPRRFSKFLTKEFQARRDAARTTLASAQDVTTGTPGESRRMLLELKLIADVGLIGFPNAGKSSLLARISTARPKIGAYPFTTRYPVLGVVSVDGRGSFVACDIPGLIEGAHEGRGLGMQFLRHIERTRLLVHLIDLAAVDGRDPVEAFHQLNRELASYDAALPEKPQLIVANKMDLPSARAQLVRFERAVGRPVCPISCATGQGIPVLLQTIWSALRALGTSHG